VAAEAREYLFRYTYGALVVVSISTFYSFICIILCVVWSRRSSARRIGYVRAIRTSRSDGGTLGHSVVAEESKQDTETL
jgi:hypothetical protein